MKTKRKSGKLRIFAVLLLLICAAAVVWYSSGSLLPLTPTQQKVWNHAMTHGLSYRDYPQSLISLLERNPETEKFVLEYPTASKNTAYIDLSEYENCDTIPLFLQWDQRWGYLQYGSDVAGLTACGPVCLSMATFYLSGGDKQFTPEKIIQFAIDNNYYVPGSGSSWTLISEGGERLGFRVTELPLDENRIRAVLEDGTPIIIVVGPGDFTNSGHYLVMTGYEDGQIRLLDPNSRANSEVLWPYQQIQSQIKNLWSIENY